MSDFIPSTHKKMAKIIELPSAEETIDCHTAEEYNDMFHDNQIIAALEIIDEFQTKNYVQLQAQMQSGKTGCSLFTALEMIEKKWLVNIL